MVAPHEERCGSDDLLDGLDEDQREAVTSDASMTTVPGSASRSRIVACSSATAPRLCDPGTKPTTQMVAEPPPGLVQ